MLLAGLPKGTLHCVMYSKEQRDYCRHLQLGRLRSESNVHPVYPPRYSFLVLALLFSHQTNAHSANNSLFLLVVINLIIPTGWR